MTTSVTIRKARNPKKWAGFLAALEKTGNVNKACKLSGVPVSTAYDKREADAEFAAKWEKAVDRAVIQLEDEARRRAHDGVNEPVFYQGNRCGVVRKYSDTLLIFLLKAARPDKYRERVSAEITGRNGGPLQSVNVSLSSDEVRDAVRSAMEKV